jgi:hypothetical protein
MGVDQPGEHDVTGKVEDFVGIVWKVNGRPDLFDPSVYRVQAAIIDLGARIIHRRQYGGVFDEKAAHGMNSRALPIRFFP